LRAGNIKQLQAKRVNIQHNKTDNKCRSLQV